MAKVTVTLNGKVFPALNETIATITGIENMTAKTTREKLGKFDLNQVEVFADALATMPADALFVISLDNKPAYEVTAHCLANRMKVTLHPEKYQVKELQPKESTKKEKALETLPDVSMLADFLA